MKIFLHLYIFIIDKKHNACLSNLVIRFNISFIQIISVQPPLCLYYKAPDPNFFHLFVSLLDWKLSLLTTTFQVAVNQVKVGQDTKITSWKVKEIILKDQVQICFLLKIKSKLVQFMQPFHYLTCETGHKNNTKKSQRDNFKIIRISFRVPQSHMITIF